MTDPTSPFWQGDPAATASSTAGAVGAQPAAVAPRPVYLLASFGQRLQARVVDTLILLVPTFALWAVLLPPLVRRASDDEQLSREIDSWDPDTGEGPIGRALFWLLVFFVVTWLSFTVLRAIYEAVFEARTAGQTPGRRSAGIRVMRVDGARVGFWWALYRTLVIRDLLFGIGALLSGGLLWLLQYLWPLWDPQRRALHDVVARSRVVQDAEST